ncbi:MAG: RDD family protein [Methanothrix sp.]|nr:RDD family protein [Methanothrix sp.]
MDKICRACWKDRFWAWLIDVLLVGILWASLLTISRTYSFSPVGLGLLMALLFVYWTALEGYRGQSLGKMLLNIVVLGQEGEKIGFKDSALESLGKAFLLPLDCLIGWVVYKGRGQRAFNKFSNTIVASANEGKWCT